MKKIFLLVIAFSFIAYNSSAQDDDDRNNIRFGLKAGANYSDIYDTEGESFQGDGKFGLVAGLFVTIPLGKLIGVQPEILFSQRGFKATGSVLGNNYQFTRTLNYVDIPLLFAVKPVGFLTILAGPQYSFLLKQKDEFSNSSISFDEEQQFDSDNLRKNVLCFTGGVDINLEHVVLGARVGWDIQKNNGDGTSTNPRYKNAWYQATLGFRF